MQKSKKTKIIIITLAVLLALILLENGIRFLVTKVSETSANKDKTVEEIVDEKKEETTKKINDSLDELIALIKNREYEKAYGKLEETYREYKFPKMEMFEEYVDSLVRRRYNSRCYKLY